MPLCLDRFPFNRAVRLVALRTGRLLRPRQAAPAAGHRRVHRGGYQEAARGVRSQGEPQGGAGGDVLVARHEEPHDGPRPRVEPAPASPTSPLYFACCCWCMCAVHLAASLLSCPLAAAYHPPTGRPTSSWHATRTASARSARSSRPCRRRLTWKSARAVREQRRLAALQDLARQLHAVPSKKLPNPSTRQPVPLPRAT